MAGYDDETVNADRRGLEPPTPRVDAGRLWAGGAASAVVAALIGLVGVLVIRAVFNVAFAGSRDAGVFGDSSTAVLCALAALAAIAATGLAHLLVLSTPRPRRAAGRLPRRSWDQASAAATNAGRAATVALRASPRGRTGSSRQARACPRG